MQGEVRVLQQLIAIGGAGREQNDPDIGRDVDQMAVDQIRPSDPVDELSGQQGCSMRLRLAAPE